MKKLILSCFAALLMAFQAQAETPDADNIIVLQLKDGPVKIQLFPDKAPNHVARIKELVRQGFYDGLKFHRVIDGFMAQTGDPKGNGTGGSGQKLKAEFNDLHHGRGAVSMARAQDPNSADSQFFICFADSGFLDGQYTVWGQVIEGMEFVDKIKRGNPVTNGTVTDPDIIVSMKVLSDTQK
ncbi:MAG: peptidylprolyl isomerase [Alphaproteobacteria bacterium]